MILSVILLVAAGFLYLVLRPQTKPAQAGWLSSGTVNSGTWSYRRKIVVSHTQVSGTSTITNFSMLINSTLSDWKTVSNGGKVGNDSGYDFVFTASDGTTKLNHEIESYASTTGQLIAWVNTGTQGLSPTTDSVFYVYYGNSSATLTEANPTAVWDSNYAGVWHLNDNAANTTVTDSTSNADNLTDLQNTNSSATSTAMFGATSFYFNGTTSPATYATGTKSNLLFLNNFTWSGWVYDATSTGNHTIIELGTGTNLINLYRTDASHGRTAILAKTGYGNMAHGVTAVPDNTWTYVVVTKDNASPQNVNIYINGVLDNYATSTYAYGTPTSFNLGVCLSVNCNSPWLGQLDEMRIASTTRSSDWIKTEYNNQSAPSYFYVFGGQEAQSSSALTPNDSTSGSAVPWLSSGTVNSGTWLYRKRIAIPHSLVSGTSTLSSFPVLVSNTFTDWKTTANGGGVGNANGYDFVFTDSGGQTKIPHEIESYASTTGQLIAWVKTNVSPTTDTVLYLYFGNSSATLTEANPTGVWDTYYKGVWHLNDNAANTTVLDSTSNGDNLGLSTTTNISATSTSFFTGLTSFYFNGQNATSSTAIMASSTSSNLLFTTNLTWSCWANSATTTSRTQFLMAQGGTTFGSGVNGALQFSYPTNTGLLYANKGGYYNMVTASSPPSVINNSWNYYTVTESSSSPYQWAIYINGALAGTASTANVLSAGTRFHLGGDLQYYTNSTMVGYLQEARVSSTARSSDWIKTEYNNQKSPSVFAVVGQTEAYSRSATTPDVKLASRSGSVPGWFATGGTWAYRRKLTIDPKLVYDSNGLTNFPMLFRETLSDLKYSGSGGKVASSTGGDIMFTDANNNLLNFEVENYASTTGELESWVSLPFASPTTTTSIYLYYDGNNSTSLATTTGVWDSNYVGVWHMKNGTTLNTNDSTQYASNATNHSYSAITGEIDGAASDTGANNHYISFATSTNNINLTNVTLSAWIKPSSYTNPDSDAQMNILGGTRESLNMQSSGYIQAIQITSGTYRTSNSSILTPKNTWSYVVAALSSTTNKWQVFLNGTEVTYSLQQAGNGTTATDTQPFTMGASPSNYAAYNWNGGLDELRMSNIARSAGWIKSEYLNQSNPEQFYSLGGAEVASGRQTSSGSTGAPAVKLRGGVKFR